MLTFFFDYGDLEKKQTRKVPNFFFSCGEKCCAPKNRVLPCTQPASRRLLSKAVMLTQMLRPRNSATANQYPRNVYIIAEASRTSAKQYRGEIGSQAYVPIRPILIYYTFQDSQLKPPTNAFFFVCLPVGFVCPFGAILYCRNNGERSKYHRARVQHTIA